MKRLTYRNEEGTPHWRKELMEDDTGWDGEMRMYLYRLWYDGAEWCCYVIAKSRGRAKSLFHNYWEEGDYIDIRGEKVRSADGHEEKILDDDCEELKELGERYDIPEEFYWEE